MRYSLRLLLILLAIAPPLLAWGYQRWSAPSFLLTEDNRWDDMPKVDVYFNSWEEYEQWNSQRTPNDGFVAIVHVPAGSP
jgi:hypothetical protein